MVHKLCFTGYYCTETQSNHIKLIFLEFLVVVLPVRQHNVYHIYFQAFSGQVKQLLKDPQELCCPISMHLMEDPVIAADGHTYERSFILKSFEVKNESPLTNAPLQTLVPWLNKKKTPWIFGNGKSVFAFFHVLFDDLDLGSSAGPKPPVVQSHQ